MYSKVDADVVNPNEIAPAEEGEQALTEETSVAEEGEDPETPF